MMLQFLPQVLWEGVIIGLIISMVAMGISLTWGVMYIVNFAQGELLMISMFMSFFFTVYTGLDPLIALPIVIVVMYFFGTLLYKVLIKKIMSATVLSQLLLTFSLGILIMNLSLITFTGRFRTVSTQHFTEVHRFESLNLFIAMNRVIPVIICLATAAVLYIILNKTQLGRAIKATALNKKAASLVGIDPEKAYTRCVGISCATAGAGGVAFSYFFYVFPHVGMVYIIFAFVAACIGGMGSIPGVLIGGIAMGLIDSIVGTYFNVSFKYLAIFMLYIIIIYKRPKGLFGW